MNQNEEVPDLLGGLGDMLPADVLKMVNELLEQLHRKDKDHQGSSMKKEASMWIMWITRTSMEISVSAQHNKKIKLHRLCHHRSAALKRWPFGRKSEKQAMWMKTINL